MAEEEKFEIAFVSRELIKTYFKAKYFGTEKASEKELMKINALSKKDLRRLAERMRGEYIENSFWDSLEYNLEHFILK